MKVRHRFFLGLVVASAMICLLTALGAEAILRAAHRDATIARVRAETRALATWVAEAPETVDLQAFAAATGQSLGLRVSLVAADGRTIAESARDARAVPAEDLLARPEMRAAASRGRGESRRRSDAGGPELFYVVERLDGEGPIRFVRTALPVSRIEEVAAHHVWTLVSAALVAFGFLTIVSYVVVRRLSAPIEQVSSIVARVAEGNLEIDVPYDAGDELGRLAASVNRMRRTLTDKIRELEDERRLLLSVLGGMREGLLVVGPDRRIRIANEAFRQIFGLGFDPAGKLLAEVIRDPTVIRDLDTAQAEGREIRDSVLERTGSGRSFELHVTPLGTRGAGGPGGALFLFFDITRLEALESVRRDFVANVSHELRTPLTAIKAFVETLVEGGLGDRENSLKFLGIVQKHAGRMEALIDDLTDLSLIETGAISLDVQSVDASEVAREVASHLAHRAAAQGVDVRVDLPGPFRVPADRLRLEQVLLNLVDNAIKFNRPGGSVRISGDLREGRPIVVVEDTGVGIPAESQDRVFNRFYRVDKARSRDLGGTGLGLAIVKHLMRLHGGQVRLESELGRGSRFILEFPGASAPVPAESA